MNELLWFSLMLVTFAGVIILHRVSGVTGLYVWIAISVIVANIQVVKTVEIFGLTATLGNVVYASSFLATDILSEYYGSAAARRGVFLGFFAIVSTAILMIVALYFVPSADDFAQSALERIFLIVPRITGASLAAYLVNASANPVELIWSAELEIYVVNIFNHSFGIVLTKISSEMAPYLWRQHQLAIAESTGPPQTADQVAR